MKRAFLFFFIFLTALPLWASEDEVLRLKGKYLVYSYDLNFIYGEDVEFDFSEYTVSSLYIKIDISAHVFYAYGDVVLRKDGEKIKGDEFLFSPEEKKGKLVNYGEKIDARVIGDKDPQSFKEKKSSLDKVSISKIKKSFLFFTGCLMEINKNYEVIGYDVTLYLAGIRSFSLKKHTLTQGTKLSLYGFSLDKVWYSKSEGLVTRASFHYDKPDKFSNATQIKYEEHTLIKGYSGRDRLFRVTSSSSYKVNDNLNLNLTGNYNSSNIWNTNFILNKKWSDQIQTQLDFTYNKSLNLKGEAWIGAASSFNAGKLGSASLSAKYELQDQVLTSFSYNKSFFKRVNLSLTSSYSKIKVGETQDYSKLFTGGLNVTYNAKIFNLGTAYNLNYDLVGGQILSQPQLSVGINPFNLYNGLLQASISNVFIYNKLKRDLLSENAYSNNTIFSLSSKPIYLQKSLSLNVNMALEQFLEKEGRNFTSGGFIIRAKKKFGEILSLEGFYSVQSRRKTKDWLISGTTSQDLSALLRVNPSDRINGWVSFSYDPKNDRLQQSFLDISIGFLKKWEFHSLVNYDFLLNKFNNIDLYLVREAGRFQLRFIYRSLSEQFLVELVPR